MEAREKIIAFLVNYEMFLNGQTLICTESFFIFKKGGKYYCSHVTDGYFFLHNNSPVFNVSTIKIPLALAKNFKVSH